MLYCWNYLEICLRNLLETCLLGGWRKLPTGRCPPRETLLQICPKGRWESTDHRAPAGIWREKLFVLHVLGLGEATCAGRGPSRRYEPWGTLEIKHQNQKTKSFPAKMSLQSTLLPKVNTVPAGKGKTLKGTTSICTEQTKRMDLERRGNKLVTIMLSHRILSSFN